MEQKNLNAGHVSLNKVILILAIFLSSNAFAQNTCEVISRGIFKTSKLNAPSQFINSFKNKLQNEKFEELKEFFHPSLHVKKSIGLRIKKVLNGKLIKPYNFNIYRIYKLSGERKNPTICEKDASFKVIPRYGYKQQYFAIISVLSSNDLARIYVSYAEKEKGFNITGLHIQQWTHAGKDYEYWTQKSLTDKDPLNKWISLDVAQKLLVGGDFTFFSDKQQITKTRDLVYSKQQILDRLRKETNNNNIVYFGTILGRSSTGAFIRVTIEKLTPGYKLKEQCSTIGQSLMSYQWFKNIDGGIRCNFIFKGMNPEEDSKVGGYYLTKNDLNNEKKDTK